MTQKLEETGSFPVNVILDVDVFLAGDFNPNAENLRPHLEILRALKNRTFFALLTEEAVKLCL